MFHRWGVRCKKTLASLLLATTMLTNSGFAGGVSNATGLADPDGPYTTTGQNENDVDPTVKVLWENMQMLKNSKTIIGPELAAFSEKHEIKYAFDSVSVYGQTSENGDITIGNKKTILQMTGDFALVTQAHETLHAIQFFRKMMDKDMTWSILDFQACVLSAEASGNVVSYLVALEFNRDGLSGPLREYKSKYPNRISHDLQTLHEQMLKDSSSVQALNQIGESAFYAMFQNQEWLDAYNENVLSLFIALTVDGQLLPPSGKGFDLSRMRDMGYISPAFNFTAGLDSLPTRNGAFGNNDRMRQAFDFAELSRLADVCGKDDPRYKTLLQEMARDGNPYLGLNIEDIWDIYSEHPGFPIFHLMNALVEDKTKSTKQKIGPDSP